MWHANYKNNSKLSTKSWQCQLQAVFRMFWLRSSAPRRKEAAVRRLWSACAEQRRSLMMASSAATRSGAAAVNVVKPIFSRDLSEARRRARELYRAWHREVPNTGRTHTHTHTQRERERERENRVKVRHTQQQYKLTLYNHEKTHTHTHTQQQQQQNKQTLRLSAKQSLFLIKSFCLNELK